MFSKNNNKGFTLVELLVVIAIIGIMSAVVLTSLASSRNQKAVEVEARKVAASIREAQNDALTGKVGWVTGKAPCEFRWRVIDQGDYWIRLRQPCGTATGDDVQYVLQNGVIFKNTDVTNLNINYVAFDFNVPFGIVTPTYSNAATRLTLKKGAYCADINVDSVSGNVTEGAVYSISC